MSEEDMMLVDEVMVMREHSGVSRWLHRLSADARQSPYVRQPSYVPSERDEEDDQR